MKKYSFLIALAFSFLIVSFTKFSTELIEIKEVYRDSHLFSSGPPTAKTGAPGEGTCTQCHSGSVMDGTSVNSITLTDGNQQVVTEYTPGETYIVSITTQAASKRGFQVSPRILSNNSRAGTSSGISSVSAVQNTSSQQYVNHVSSSTGALSWEFNWTAPATNEGDVRFYLATNVANGNNSTSGDNIFTSQHTFSAVSGASVKENSDDQQFSVYHTNDQNRLMLEFYLQDPSLIFLNLVDLSGKSVFSKRIVNAVPGKNLEEVYLPKELHDGVYVVHFFKNNDSFSKKIYIKK